MQRSTGFGISLAIIATMVFVSGAGTARAQGKGKIVHDAEYYIIEAQNSEKWAAEDNVQTVV